MWPFARKPKVNDLRGYKKITVCGMRFVIKRLNPLLDFTSQNMPQIFTDYQTIRDKPQQDNTPERIKKLQEDMYAVIQAGVIEPPLSKDGISTEDLFRDPDIGVGLYQAILEHSLNRFKGLKKLFFLIRTRYNLYITWLRLSRPYRTTLFSKAQKPVN